MPFHSNNSPDRAPHARCQRPWCEASRYRLWRVRLHSGGGGANSIEDKRDARSEVRPQKTAGHPNGYEIILFNSDRDKVCRSAQPAPSVRPSVQLSREHRDKSRGQSHREAIRNGITPAIKRHAVGAGWHAARRGVRVRVMWPGKETKKTYANIRGSLSLSLSLSEPHPNGLHLR